MGGGFDEGAQLGFAPDPAAAGFGVFAEEHAQPVPSHAGGLEFFDGVAGQREGIAAFHAAVGFAREKLHGELVAALVFDH